jgi:hypothetical protein
MCSKIQPDDVPVGSKHGAECVLYKAELAGYCLFFILKVFHFKVSKRTQRSHFLRIGVFSCSKPKVHGRGRERGRERERERERGRERERAVEIRELDFHSAPG